MLGRVGGKQPDWFVAVLSSLQPLILKHDALFFHWVQSGHPAKRPKGICLRSVVWPGLLDVARASSAPGKGTVYPRECGVAEYSCYP